MAGWPERSSREGKGRLVQMTDGLVVPMKAGNAAGGKEPCSGKKDQRSNSLGDW